MHLSNSNYNAKTSTLGLLSQGCLNVLLAHFRRRNIDTQPFLALANITQATLNNHSYDLSELIKYCQKSIEISGDELFPMRAGRRMQLAEFPVIGALSMHSSSMSQVIEDLVFFLNQTNKDEFKVEMVYQGGHGYVRFIPTSGYTDEELGPYMDLIMAGIAYNCFIIAHDMNVSDLKQPEVYFRHQAPTDPDRVARLFQMPVKFEQEYYQLRLDEAFLHKPLISADLDTYKVMKNMMKKTAAIWTEEISITDKVKALLQSTQQPHLCSIDEVATTLNLSKSTLQRKLQHQQSSYRDIQKIVIETRAKDLLTKTQQPIQEVALALGYLEITSFHRAFKRWTGQTPSEFRDNR